MPISLTTAELIGDELAQVNGFLVVNEEQL
jgi:hypothetical protein